MNLSLSTILATSYIVYAIIVIIASITSPIVRMYMSMYSWMHLLFNLLALSVIAFIAIYGVDCMENGGGENCVILSTIVTVLVVFVLLFQSIAIFFVHSKYSIVPITATKTSATTKSMDEDEIVPSSDDHEEDTAEEEEPQPIQHMDPLEGGANNAEEDCGVPEGYTSDDFGTYSYI